MAISILPSGSRLAMIAAVSLGALLVSAPVQAQDYPMVEDTLSSSAADLEPGTSTEVSGSGFLGGTDVVITAESAPVELDTVSANSSGAFSATVTIPTNLSAGTHTLKATGMAADGASTLVLSTEFVVGGDDSLPETGHPIGLLASVSGVVLLGGLGVLGYGIRRRLRMTPAGL
jgi:hypothetical protein